jgi:phosphate transport system substrate-binding protein
MLSRKKLAVVVITASALLASSSPAFAAVINGSGATFAQPLIDSCRVQFLKETGHDVNYGAGGSGKGRTDLSNKIVDWAGSDAPYNPSSLEPKGLVYAPVFAAPIAIFYNLPGLSDTITLSADTLAKIYSGEIQKWNDKAIVADNKRVTKEPIFKTKQVKQTVTDKKTKKKTTKTTTVPVLDAQGKPVISGYKEKCNQCI